MSSTLADLPSGLLLAHAGHWATSLVYIAPVVAVIAYLIAVNRKDRRAAARDAPPE